MAQTNRAKGAVRSPAWAARSKLRLAHVRGGPAEAAALIHRGLWDKTPAGLLPAARYGAEFVEELLKAKINAVCLTWSPGFSVEGDVPQWEVAARLLPLLKKKKIRAFAEFSLTGCFASEFLPRVTEAKSWLERQPDGKPIAHSNDNCLQLNVQHEGWRQYLAHKVRMAAGARIDGFFFSDVVCKPADGGDFLTFLIDAARTGRIPEIDEFAFYTSSTEQHIVAATNLKWLPSAARQIPDERHFAANIPLLKALFEVGGRDRTLFCGIPEQSTEKEARICAAEILASGGACHGLRAPANYQTFCASHNDIFGVADPVSALGFLADDESGAFSRLKADAALFERLLGRAIQFDVIPLSAIDSFDLKKYRVLSVLHLEQVPEELGARLAAFYKNGGAVLYPATPPDDAGVPPPPRTETTDGKGAAIHYAVPLNDETRKLLLDDLSARLDPQLIGVEDATHVVALLWGKSTRRWVHVINYATKYSDVTITLPGCGGRKLSVLSPDAPPPQLNVLETGNANAKFTLKGVETFAVVVVE